METACLKAYRVALQAKHVLKYNALAALLMTVTLGACVRGIETSVTENPITLPARVEGNRWRPLFLGEEQIFVRYVDDENMGVFSTAVLVDPGPHCIVGEVTRSGLFNSDDGWTEPLCFDAQAGQTYRMRRRAGRYQMVNAKDGSVVAEGGWVSEIE